MNNLAKCVCKTPFAFGLHVIINLARLTFFYWRRLKALVAKIFQAKTPGRKGRCPCVLASLRANLGHYLRLLISP